MAADPLSPNEAFILDMLGEDLKTAVLGARERTGDQTIMARIDTGLCIVSRGGEDVAEGLGHDTAVAAIETLD